MRLSELIDPFDLPKDFQYFLASEFDRPSVQAFIERRAEFSSPVAALFAGLIATDRSTLESYLRTALLTRVPQREDFDEVVIGAGLHGCVYACNRPSKDVLLIDAGKNSPGGIFNLTRKPVFYLNSRNRREGGPRLPGTNGPLNSIVGGAVQPSDINGAEYQTNADLALAIRLNILLSGVSLFKGKVSGVFALGDGINVEFRTGLGFDAGVLTLATGLGVPSPSLTRLPGKAVSFNEFFIQVGRSNFPLRGKGNVAVVGAGDSANVVVEYMLGQGPTSPMVMDLPERILWFGQSCRYKEDFEEDNRSRYAGIGRYMPRRSDPEYYFRVRPQPGRVTRVETDDRGMRVWYAEMPGYSAEVMYPDSFDLVVYCNGFEDRSKELLMSVDSPDWNPREFDVIIGGRTVAKKINGHNIYKVGPCADLPVTEAERQQVPVLKSIPANSVAAFRYTERTAEFARALDNLRSL